MSTSGSERSIGELLAIAVDAAADAARVVHTSFGHREALIWEEKGSADFVTQVDRDAEAAIRNARFDAAFSGSAHSASLVRSQ